MNNLETVIERVVNDAGMIKGVELAVEIAHDCHTMSPDDFHEAISNLVKARRIVEVEYSSDNRVKSIFFAQGTIVTLV